MGRCVCFFYGERTQRNNGIVEKTFLKEMC